MGLPLRIAMYPPRLLIWIVTFGLLVHLMVLGLRRRSTDCQEAFP